MLDTFNETFEKFRADALIIKDQAKAGLISHAEAAKKVNSLFVSYGLAD